MGQAVFPELTSSAHAPGSPWQSPYGAALGHSCSLSLLIDPTILHSLQVRLSRDLVNIRCDDPTHQELGEPAVIPPQPFWGGLRATSLGREWESRSLPHGLFSSALRLVSHIDLPLLSRLHRSLHRPTGLLNHRRPNTTRPDMPHLPRIERLQLVRLVS